MTLAAHGHADGFTTASVRRHFFNWELPKVDAQLDLLASVDTTTLDMRDTWF